MTENHELDLPFEEDLLSGYLDGALTQQDTQRVELHLERSADAQRLLEELRIMREASMSTTFRASEDRQWDEAARTPVSRGFRWLGLVLLAAWAIATIGYGVWEANREAEGLLERVLLFGGLGGAVLLFLSTLLDRLRDGRTDRYKGVKR